MNPTLLGFLRKEFAQALRDPRMRVLIFVLPIVQLLIFGYALSTEIRNIRLVTNFAPDDVLACRLSQRCLASTWFIPAAGPLQDPLRMLQANQADAALLAPPGGLTRAVQRGEGKVQLLIEGTNLVRARGVEQYLLAILRQVSLAESPGLVRLPQVSLDVRVLYNPALRTSYFLIPGVMCMVLSILTVILTSMALAKEKELGTFEALVSAPVKNSEILLGKTLPYAILALLDVPLILGTAMLVFGVPMRGWLWQVLLASGIFIITTVSIGTVISTYARNQQQAMLGSFFFIFPAMLLSGIMFPVENMPAAVIGAAYLNPLRYFITLLRNIMLKGGDPMVVWSNLGIMSIMALVAMILAARRFHQTLN